MKDDEMMPQTVRDTQLILKSRQPSLRQFLRHVVPRSIRVERVRLKRYPTWLLEHPFMATQSHRDPGLFPHLLAQRHSPMCREGVDVDDVLQQGKITNVQQATKRITSTIIQPGQLFSYHHLVGRPSYQRGFVDGPELHNQTLSKGVGGGCCQITNMLYQLALLGNLEIVERHRHSLDLYPDHQRTVPFGCGATVFYNRADLRFRNTHDHPIYIYLNIEQNQLTGQLLTHQPVNFWVDVFDQDHRFFQQHGHWFRQNTIYRTTYTLDGHPTHTEHIDNNLATTLYTPTHSTAPPVHMRSDHATHFTITPRGLLGP